MNWQTAKFYCSEIKLIYSICFLIRFELITRMVQMSSKISEKLKEADPCELLDHQAMGAATDCSIYSTINQIEMHRWNEKIN